MSEKFLEKYDNIAQARVRAALVMHIKLLDFERLKEILKSEFPDASVIFDKVSVQKLWIKEGEP
jgi:hypothetical protein